MSRRQVVEDQVSHERWLVSYADFITLLFAFFVVMYSISQVNEGKYKVLSQTLSEVFTQEQLNNPELVIDPFQVGDVAKSNPRNVIKLEGNALLNKDGDSDQYGDKQGVAGGELPGGLPEEFQQINNKLDAVFSDLLQQDMLTVRGNEEWLEVELKSSLLFPSGDAVLSIPALQLLGSIADILRGQDNPVRVEGFTDNVPINTGRFPSNWELSTARASSVVKLFIEEGLAANRFAAIGYGEFQPLEDNRTDEGRAANRRVVLMISRTGELRPELRQLTTAEELLNGDQQQGNSGIEIIIPGIDDSDPTADPVENRPANQNGLPGIRTIELEDGGLLFTNDTPREEPAQP